MKLRNKKTGEIGNLVLNINPNRESYSVLSTENGDTVCGNSVLADYDSLAELNEEWEDYEEPNFYYYISDFGAIRECEIGKFPEDEEDRKQIGNYFETKEEAEKAAEKLKAWQRLKDKGFKFTGWKCTGSISFAFDNYCGDGQPMSASDYLDLLFGGEDE